MHRSSRIATLVAALILGLTAPAYAQTPPVPDRGNNAQQEILERTRDDSVLNEIKQQNSDDTQEREASEAASSLRSAESSGILGKLPSQKKLDELKALMQQEPNNLDHYFAYAQTATALGEHGEAAKTYESMLELMPTLDRVRLDLGVSYMKLGRLEDAKREMEAVLNRQPPESVQNNIRTVLARIDDELRESDFDGSIAVGLNLDSNGNSAPGSDSILIFDTVVPLSAGQRKQEDLQLFVAGSLNHTYRPRWARGEDITGRWKSTASVYHAEQSSLETLDLKVLSLKTGPEFQGNESGAKISPKVGYNHIILGTNTYLRSISTEVDGEYPISSSLALTGNVRHEFRDFVNAPNVSTYEDRTGSATQETLGLRYMITPQDIAIAQLTHRRERTRRDYYDNEQWGANLAYTRLFNKEVFSTLSAGYRDTVYDDADTLLSSKTRHDKEKSGGLTVGYKLTDEITATAGYQYRDVNSNLLNYDYDNHRFSTALSIRF